jgi:hypothetical protein
MSLSTIKNESGFDVYGAAEGQVGSAVAVDSQGRLLTAGGGSIGLPTWDYMAGTETSATEETYEYYQGGSGGTLVATVLITYTDAGKGFIASIEKT